MSMRFVPPASHPSTSTLSFSSPSAPGIHDTLRATLNPVSLPSTNTTTHPDPANLQSTHPLEARLKAWNTTQENLKLQSLRRTFGMAEPIRRGMELKIVRQGEWRPMVLGGSATIHSDILAGKDAECEWEDVFKGGADLRRVVGFHEEMERKLKIV